MTLRELAELVRTMRTAQNNHSIFRSPGWLKEKEALEHMVDSALQEVLSPGLFDGPPPAAPTFGHEGG